MNSLVSHLHAHRPPRHSKVEAGCVQRPFVGQAACDLKKTLKVGHRLFVLALVVVKDTQGAAGDGRA